MSRSSPDVGPAGLLTSLAEFIDGRGVELRTRPMPCDRPAEFDGVSITLNENHPIEPRCYYLVHSFGSIVGWSVDFERVASIFEELRRSKTQANEDPGRLERALDAFRAFEERSSEYAVWVLHALDYDHHTRGFTEFFRADLEAITLYHRHGRGPDWPTFLARWKADVASGRRRMSPFRPRSVPEFAPRRIELQEVVQQRDGTSAVGGC